LRLRPPPHKQEAKIFPRLTFHILTTSITQIKLTCKDLTLKLFA